MAAHIQDKVYWVEEAGLPLALPHAPLPSTADVVIVGGGYTGLSAARELARAGSRVVVCEARTLGWGASSRNGGQVLTGTKLSASGLLKRFGAETGKAMWRASMQAITYIENIIAEEQIGCDFARSGHAELAFKPAHANHFAHEADVLAKYFDHSVTLLSKAQLAGEIGSDSYYGGLLDPRSAGLHPGRYVAGLIRACARAGVTLCENSEIQAITRGGAGFRVRTAHGELSCAHVLIASNGYTGGAVPWLQRRIVPVGSYIIATAPFDEALARQLSPHNRMFYDSKNYLYYWRLTRDARGFRMIFGGRAEFTPPTPDSTQKSVAALRAGLLYVYPQLSTLPIDYVWGGTLGFSFDLLPHAGRTDDGLHYALGCGGHGVAMLSYLGACSARRMLGHSVADPTFALPFPGAPLGLYNGTPWFLPLAGAYYKAKDALS
jgi:glycine/D-amino acid oxidase-like deaminating enzyme